MSRVFDGTGNQNANSNLSIAWPTTGSIALWFNPAWNSGDSTQHYLFNITATDFFNGLKYSDNNCYFGWDVGGTDYRVVFADTGIFSNGTWVHVGATWVNNGTITAYINGISKGTHAGPNNPSVTHSLTIAANGPSTGANGSIADIAYWNVALTGANMSSLAGGNRPSSISSGLQSYWPFAGTASPEPDTADSNNMILAGSPTQGGDPPYNTYVPFKPPAMRRLLVR